MKEKVPFDKSIPEGFGKKPSLLLHSCCAPCSSSVLEMLWEYFDVTVLYYNPNIFPEAEFVKRQKEQEKFCSDFLPDTKIRFVSTTYVQEEFEEKIKGLEREREGGARCTACFMLRLEYAASYAKENGFDFFTTTLSVSPLKDAKRLNAIGKSLEEKYGVSYLVSDFKKQNGYKRSCEISREYNMYRQDFCGCKFSLAERIMSSKGFIFDLDGTLLDTMGFYEDFASNALRALGKKPRENVREQVRSFTIRDACEFFRKEYEINMTTDEIYSLTQKMVRKLYEEDAELKKGAKEFIELAHSLGIKLSIATASPKEEILLAIKRLGIEDKFDCILTCPELGTTKRVPFIYDKCTEALGLSKKDVTVFEDAHHAVATAKYGGYRVVAVKEETELKFMDKIQDTADIFVDSMMDLVLREKL